MYFAAALCVVDMPSAFIFAMSMRSAASLLDVRGVVNICEDAFCAADALRLLSFALTTWCPAAFCAVDLLRTFIYALLMCIAAA